MKTPVPLAPSGRGVRGEGSGGFTLMEVLAAIVLIAIVLPVAMHGIGLAASLAGAARNKAEAAVLAHSKLNELQVTRAWQGGILNGDFGDDHPGFQWTAELDEWDASTLKQLDVHVLWTAGGRPEKEQVTVSTLVETEAN